MDRKQKIDKFAITIACLLTTEGDPNYARQQMHRLIDKWHDKEHGEDVVTGATNVYDFGLDPRISNELDRHGIRTIADVCNHSRATLLILAALSAARVDEIEAKLLKHGFTLKD